jgi:hypothetical protein
MRTSLLFLLALGLAAGALAPPAEAKIRTNHSIGRIALGMSGAQVRRILGKPDTTVWQRVRASRFVKYDYMMSKSWTVTLILRKGRLTVVEIGTTSPSQRTPAGAGVGISEGKLRKLHPGVRCRDVRPDPDSSPIERQCLFARNGRQTVFIIGVGPNPHEVLSVMVRNARLAGAKRI